METSPMARLQLKLPQAVFDQLELHAKQLGAKCKTPAQYEWVTSHPGRLAWSQINEANRLQYYRKPLKVLNEELRAAYLQATGAQATGRPNTSRYMVAVLEEALALYAAIHPLGD